MARRTIPLVGAGLLAVILFLAAAPALNAVVYVAEEARDSAVAPVIIKDIVPGDSVSIDIGVVSPAVDVSVSVDVTVGEPATVEHSAEVHAPASSGRARSI